MLPPKGKHAVVLRFFFSPWTTWPEMVLNGAGKIFFRLIQTLPAFGAELILILVVVSDGKFPDSQVPKFQTFPKYWIIRLPKFRMS